MVMVAEQLVGMVDEKLVFLGPGNFADVWSQNQRTNQKMTKLILQNKRFSKTDYEILCTFSYRGDSRLLSLRPSREREFFDTVKFRVYTDQLVLIFSTTGSDNQYKAADKINNVVDKILIQINEYNKDIDNLNEFLDKKKFFVESVFEVLEKRDSDKTSPYRSKAHTEI